MIVVGVDHLEALLGGSLREAKMVLTERRAIVFPVSCQHRDVKAQGISYEDEYRGNALAAMLRSDSIEIRFHRDFDDVRVARIVGELVKRSELSFLAGA